MFAQLQTLAPPGRFKARTFFEHVCPALFRAKASDCRALGGRYTFNLTGLEGGSWTLDFVQLAVLHDSRNAALHVEMPVDAFESLMAGELDLACAEVSGLIIISGDRALFSRLAWFTEPTS